MTTGSIISALQQSSPSPLQHQSQPVPPGMVRRPLPSTLTSSSSAVPSSLSALLAAAGSGGVDMPLGISQSPVPGQGLTSSSGGPPPPLSSASSFAPLPTDHKLMSTNSMSGGSATILNPYSYSHPSLFASFPPHANAAFAPIGMSSPLQSVPVSSSSPMTVGGMSMAVGSSSSSKRSKQQMTSSVDPSYDYNAGPKRPKLPDDLSGKTFDGTITERFDFGYFVDISLGARKYRGMIFSTCSQASHAQTPGPPSSLFPHPHHQHVSLTQQHLMMASSPSPSLSISARRTSGDLDTAYQHQRRWSLPEALSARTQLDSSSSTAGGVTSASGLAIDNINPPHPQVLVWHDPDTRDRDRDREHDRHILVKTASGQSTHPHSHSHPHSQSQPQSQTGVNFPSPRHSSWASAPTSDLAALHAHAPSAPPTVPMPSQNSNASDH